MAKLTTLSPTLRKVLEIAKLNVPVTPTEINDYVGAGNYASKHVLYLKILGYDFAVTKDGRKVASYTLIKEPTNASALVSAADSKGKGASKTKAAPKKATVKAKVEAPVKAKAESKAAPKKTTAKKKVAAAKKAPVARGGSAANLAKLKAVGARFEKSVKKFDEVEDTFGTSGELGAIDGGWDSIEGLDLSKLL